MASKTQAPPAAPARTLIGHLSEYQRLLTVLDAQPGTVVVAADPLSGASAVVRSALEELGGASVYVDARGALDDMDLAMAIADAAVGVFRPEASAWWTGSSPVADLEGLRLHRTLSERGVDLEDLRHGSGSGDQLLRIALELTVALAQGPVVLALDHLDDLAEGQPKTKGRPLATLRAMSQEEPQLHLLLVGRTDGAIERAIHDSDHPLFQAGQVERFRRAPPSRFVDDLAIARPWTDAPIEIIRTAAELTSGAPAHLWNVVDLAAKAPGTDGVSKTLQAWHNLRVLTEAQTAAQFNMLRAVQPVAQSVVSALAAGLGAYTLPINDGRVRAALMALQRTGVVWQPRERDWAVADPLLAAWARDHAQPWIRRRARAATGQQSR